MLKVNFNSNNENPFYGMGNTLRIFQNGSKGQSISKAELEAAWNECEDENAKAALFSVLFSIGDITGRQHNIFDSKVESGGNSERNLFRDTIIPFMVSKTPVEDIQGLMTLITEYTTMDNIFANRVQTKKGKAIVTGVINMIDVYGEDNVAKYAQNIILNGTEFQKICLAKFLTRPVQSKRQGHKRMLNETREVMNRQVSLLKKISDLTGLMYEDKVSYVDFKGYYAWRKPYIQNLESFIFSTGLVKEYTEEDFINMLNILPSDARFRVRNRVLFDDKWKLQGEWYKKWEKFKETAQTEQRVLETRIEQGVATETEKATLKDVKKAAKVTTGAVNFAGMYKEIINGTVDKVKIQPFLDKVSLPYNSLVFVDDSGSMRSNRGNGFSARQFGAFMATICMMKNPDADAKSIMGLFSNTCRLFSGISTTSKQQNSLLVPKIQKINTQPLIDSEKHFLENLNRMSRWLDSQSSWNGTNINSVVRAIIDIANGNPNLVEELRKYPVWTFISDGNFNNMGSAEASLNDFFRSMENKLGFKPFIILIDVAGNTSADIRRFSGIDNIMMVPPNPSAIEMFLTNFRDMDVYDIYTPLLSMYRSKRYRPIRNLILLSENSSKKKTLVEEKV